MAHTSISIHATPSGMTVGHKPDVLTIEIHTESDGYSEITFFTDNAPLVKALVDAFKAATAMPAEDAPADDDTQYGEVV